MNTLVCREGAEKGERMRRRILRILEARLCIRVDELCRQLGEPEDVVLAELESLLLRGDVERLRPVGYAKGDLDAYAIPRSYDYPWED